MKAYLQCAPVLKFGLDAEHGSRSRRGTLTDENVGYCSLLCLGMEVVLNVRAVISLVQST
jgi:hypothetical protein